MTASPIEFLVPQARPATGAPAAPAGEAADAFAGVLALLRGGAAAAASGGERAAGSARAPAPGEGSIDAADSVEADAAGADAGLALSLPALPENTGPASGEGGRNAPVQAAQADAPSAPADISQPPVPAAPGLERAAPAISGDISQPPASALPGFERAAAAPAPGDPAPSNAPAGADPELQADVDAQASPPAPRKAEPEPEPQPYAAPKATVSKADAAQAASPAVSQPPVKAQPGLERAAAAASNPPAEGPQAEARRAPEQTAAPTPDRTARAAVDDVSAAPPAPPVKPPAVEKPQSEKKTAIFISKSDQASARTGDAAVAEPRAADPGLRAPDPAAASAGARTQADAALILTPAKTPAQAPLTPLETAPDAFEPAPDPALDPASGERATETRADIQRSQAAAGQTQAQARLAPHAAHALGAHIARRFNDGARVFDIRLDPPELGRVEVKLELGPDNKVSAVLTAERADSLDALQRSARDLEKALAEAGLDLADNGLSFQLGEDRSGGEARDEAATPARLGETLYARLDDSPADGETPPRSIYGFALRAPAGVSVSA